jgi:hypothetical protein
MTATASNGIGLWSGKVVAEEPNREAKSMPKKPITAENATHALPTKAKTAAAVIPAERFRSHLTMN